jgi:transcriptional regulator with XRE-family HTH domain/mannose-6-phosphate isomerase-like protein (cupin superfamily)
MPPQKPKTEPRSRRREPEPAKQAVVPTADQHGPGWVGKRLREERERQGIGLRELSRRVGVSASMISQIELERAAPSVATLYAIVNELNISLDELFFEAGEAQGQGGNGARGGVSSVGAVVESPQGRSSVLLRRGSASPVVRSSERNAIHLGSGVTWERMNTPDEYIVDFLYVTYEVGGASANENALIRHGGREYGHLLEGSLAVTVGFETYMLEPGDSISFDSTVPHRLFNVGEVPAKAIWFVIGREDPRTISSHRADTPAQ